MLKVRPHTAHGTNDTFSSLEAGRCCEMILPAVALALRRPSSLCRSILL
jgi:hypothetical protein